MKRLAVPKGKKKRKVLWIIIGVAILSISLSGCANVISGVLTAAKAEHERSLEAAKQKPKMTQLQIRQLQTRTYDNRHKPRVLQVALAVLQDDGFTVNNANIEIGLLTATKQLYKKKVDTGGIAFFKGFFGSGSSISEEKFQKIDATLTVTPFGKKIRVRISLRLASSSSRGEFNYTAITNPKPYQDFFSKLEKGLFIEREKL